MPLSLLFFAAAGCQIIPDHLAQDSQSPIPAMGAGGAANPTGELQPALTQTAGLESIPAQQSAPGQPAAGPRLILAHYLSWYKTKTFSGDWQHWNWDPNGDGPDDAGDHDPSRYRLDGFQDLAAVHRPLLGPYDSRDLLVLEYHLALAWAAGIDGFVINWLGPRDREGIDQAVLALFDTAERMRQAYGLQFYLAISFDEQQLDRSVPTAAVEQAAINLKYLIDTYANQAMYLSFQDQPVVFYFELWQDGQPGLLTPEALGKLQEAQDPMTLLYMGAESPYLAFTDGFFSWISGANGDPLDWGSAYLDWVYPEMAAQTQSLGLGLTVGGVWPGFDDSGVNGWGQGSRYIGRQDGQVYQMTWETAHQAVAGRETNWIQILTWNDWNEGTEIEPSVDFGYTYLQATQAQAARLTGRQMPASALEIPAQLLSLRRSYGAEANEPVDQVYRLFFAGQFQEAQALLDEIEP
jgi:hypothetical protein